MQQPPPIPGPPSEAVQRERDREHIKLLVIFHYVFAGFAVLGILFLAVHYAVMSAVFMNPEMWKEAEGGPPPEQIIPLIRVFYVAAGLAIIGFCAVNVLSAVCMRRRRHRVFSLIVAGLNCLNFPLGTTLGVFTIIILVRPTVLAAYGEA